MITIDEYCKLLNVKCFSSKKKIHKAYNKLALKYHPAIPKNRYQKERFITIYLAYDMLIKLNTKRKGRFRTRNEIFEEWSRNEKQAAIDKATSLANLTLEEFEKTIFIGFSKFINLTYGIFMIIATFALAYPLKLFLEGELSFRTLLIITGIYSFPLFMTVKKIMKREENISRKIKRINKPKSKFNIGRNRKDMNALNLKNHQADGK